MKGRFLLEIIRLEDFEHSRINIIDAPCGSGKTAFAVKHLPKIKPINAWGEKDMLYLIDAKMGKEIVFSGV